MTIYDIVFWVAGASLVALLLLRFATKSVKSLLISFLQLFCGFLFLFSGWMKLVDPIGTAYKMEQYFGEFQATFEGVGALSWMSGLFPWLSGYAAGFSMLMIILEMVIGLTLVLGLWRKLTTWSFLLLIVFFTILTGFTFLTGYVPTDANFFDFGAWTDYKKTNMRVTDCGCFGDFIKLEPKTSFLKDVFLLGPGIILLLFQGKMHQLFKPSIRTAIVGVATVAMTWYGLSNFVWNIPDFDFRPFTVGDNIREKRKAELKAAEEVQITHLVMKNAKTGEKVNLPYADYAKEYKKYPKPDWSVVEQLKTEPAIPETKLSHFLVEDVDGNDLTEEVLTLKEPALWVISNKLPFTTEKRTVTRQDSLFEMQLDTLASGEIDSARVFTRIVSLQEDGLTYTFDEDYLSAFNSSIRPVIEGTGYKTYAMYGGMDPESLQALKNQLGLDLVMLETDDILLKTIVRSNPGLLLVRDGVIVDKWHHKQVPSAEAVKAM